MARRTPTGAAVLQPSVTNAITEAVLDELAEQGYARLSMEAVAKRAGVGKSALYRRWPSKQEMAISVISEFSLAQIEVPDTGSLRGDLRATLDTVMRWLTHPGSPGSWPTWWPRWPAARSWARSSRPWSARRSANAAW
ncbi:TetR/AcrR family transcriptional regulator [Thermocatellispora tengchongensis]|uniref:TetR/AcrR family transcriptional regulator n=1 Tax=Thermocatellispora tengchongensis TaxID=1073253 RepID=UPI00362AA376